MTVARIKSTTFLILAIAALGLLMGSPAATRAQGIERLGEFNHWHAYAFKENGKKTCYMASAPTKDEGAYKKRGKIYARVTHRPAENTKDEVSFLAGYTFKGGSWVKVKIDKKKPFDLFTHEDSAWAPDQSADRKLVRAMKAGHQMVVEGTSSRGTATKDTYSLSGFTKAYNAIAKACGV
ncbi:MAG: invasion associated locus B family protein [Pseudomonadota bacterium]